MALQYVKLYNWNLGVCKIGYFSGDKSLFLGWHGSEACSTRFAANDNDDENDNFHMEVNCQFSIIHCQSSFQRAKWKFTCNFSASAAELKTKFNLLLRSTAMPPQK